MYNSVYPNINFHRPNLQYSSGVGYNAPNSRIENNEQESHRSNQQNSQQQTFPNGTKAAIDYSKGQINISQVLTDFRSTIIAINAPDEVKDEVNLYLNLVDRESKKAEPNREIILANLKNASRISDSYIARSLNKPSNVVEGWIDALFMQRINLKANPDEINPDFLLDLPNKKQVEPQIEEKPVEKTPVEKDSSDVLDLDAIAQESENHQLNITSQEEKKEEGVKKSQVSYEDIEVESAIEISDSEQVQSDTNGDSAFAPEGQTDLKARNMLLRAKALPKDSKGYTEALNMLNEALGLLSDDINSNQNIRAALHFERAMIFDKYDYVDYALRDYYEATNASDFNLKANAFFKSGGIYQEFSEFSPALDNYLSSVAYSGEANNQVGQTKALSKIADLFAKQYDSQKLDDFSLLAIDSAQQTQDDTLIADTYSNTAQNFQYIGENDKALANYRDAIQMFSRNDESYEQMAYNYEQAAIVMDKLGNSTKAQKLQQKALRYYQLAQQSSQNMEAVS